MTSGKIFISYAREDQDTAIRLYHDLKEAGFNPWLDKECLLPGENWQLSIRNAIESSSKFILLMSTKSVTKTGFVNKEVRLALDFLDRHPESSTYFIPARIDDCTPPFSRIEELNRLDLFPSYKEGVARLVRSLGYARPGDGNESVGELKVQLKSSELDRQLIWRASIVIRRSKETSWWRGNDGPWYIEGDGLPSEAIMPGEVVHIEVVPGRYKFRVGYSSFRDVADRIGITRKGYTNTWEGVIKPGVNKFECGLDKSLSARNIGSFITKVFYWFPTGVHFSYESYVIKHVGLEGWPELQES